MDRRRGDARPGEGRGRRSTAAAITVICALTVLVLPAQAAYAVPGAPVAPDPTSASAPASGEGRSLEQVRQEIEDLYGQAASATDAYNLAEEQAEKQSTEIVRLSRAIVDGQLRIDDLQRRAGAAARAQYRAGGMPDQARLVLTDDPDLFLDGVGRLRQGQKATKDLLVELKQKQGDLEQYTKDASAHWTRLENARARQAERKKEIEAKIDAAEKLESRLEADERERLLELERQEQARAQRAWLESGALKSAEKPTGAGAEASTAGGKAVAFATAQIGKPYVWGAEGPDSYDCSGLTSQAWAAAGTLIPRTSQEQWRLLPRVDVADLRPGDLIIYHADASHVGMYIGDGQIVHAPRPGRQVTIAGAGSMRILGAVRPDAATSASAAE
ncbi:C40 family peptidase [Streptomyces lichenis]|uniref:C40 family peptidase n=1 Tax=Streptomyces lichenis TaxID=2306967 RepID=A0ABT0IGT9_9ACTN|nr:C40 family peptidase [Streptomyces lichenis]MCK8680541.1 C40 family peptidase [Streptomyces lichenis]